MMTDRSSSFLPSLMFTKIHTHTHTLTYVHVLACVCTHVPRKRAQLRTISPARTETKQNKERKKDWAAHAHTASNLHKLSRYSSLLLPCALFCTPPSSFLRPSARTLNDPQRCDADCLKKLIMWRRPASSSCLRDEIMQ